MNGLIEILTGLVFGYLAATLSESLLHRFIGHASYRTRRLCRRFPLLSRLISQLHFGHAVVHHGKTFRKNHVTQFRSSAEQKQLDEELISMGNQVSIRTRYGLITDAIGVFCFAAPPATSILLVCWMFLGQFPAYFLLSAAIPIATAPTISICLHPYLHLSMSEADSTAPPLPRWVLNTRYGNWARMHHFVHHKHPKYNFNLLPGGDYLLGCYRAPSNEDVEQMNAMGLILMVGRQLEE